MAHEAEAYVIPKGHVELSESLEKAALREVKEETGLASVKLVTYLGNIVEDEGSTVEKRYIFSSVLPSTRQRLSAAPGGLA